MTVPEPGITTKARVTRVVDGDTIEVEVSRIFNVRVRDLLVAEKNTEKGKLAKTLLSSAIKDSDVPIFFPSNDPHKLMDMNSFNRLIGDVWLVDGTNMVDYMEQCNLGRRLKPGEKPHEGE